MIDTPRVVPLGEAALTVRFADVPSVEMAEQAAAFADRIRAEAWDAVHDVVSAPASFSVYYDPFAAGATLVRARLDELLARGVDARATRDVASHEVPTRYDGADLDEVAERTGLTRDDVIARHHGREYRVLAVGFLPGWGYLGPLDPALSLPRRSSPRTRIPAGSVAIAGAQTGIYPRESPGGWHLIGTTHVVLFDATLERPSLFRAGDRVRFVVAP